MALRIPLYSILGLLLIIGLAVVFLQTPLCQNRLRVFIEDMASSHLNATVRIGEIQGSIISDITLKDITLVDSENRDILFLDQISLSYFLPKALVSVIHLEIVAIHGLQLHLEKEENGTWNVSNLVKASNDATPEENSPFPFIVKLARFDMTDSLLILSDTPTNNAEAPYLSVNRFSAGLEYGNALELTVFDSDVVFHQPKPVPASLSGNASFSTKTGELSLDRFLIQSNGARLTANGDCRFGETSPVFSLKAVVEHLDLSEISRLFSMSELPKAEVSGTAAVSGTPLHFHHDISLEVEKAQLSLAGDSGFDDTRGLWTRFSADVRDFDLSKGWLPPGVPLSGSVSGEVTVNGSGLQSSAIMDARTSGTISGLLASEISIDDVGFAASWSSEALSIDRFEVQSGSNLLSLFGTLNPNDRRMNLKANAGISEAATILDPLKKRYLQSLDTLSINGDTNISANLEGWFDRPSVGFSITSRDVGFASYCTGALNISGRWQGPPGPTHRLDDLILSLEEVSGDRFNVKRLEVSADWTGPIAAFSGDMAVEAMDASIFGQHFENLSLSGRITPEMVTTAIAASHLNGSRFELDGNVAPWKTDGKEITLDRIFISTTAPWPESRLGNTAPVHILFQPGALTVHNCRLALNGAQIALSGDLSPKGSQNLDLEIDHLEISDIPGDWNTNLGISGMLSAEAALGGSFEKPEVSISANVKNLSRSGVDMVTDLSAAIDYAQAGATVHASLSKQGEQILTADGNLPLALSLSPFSATSGTGAISATLETHDLKFSELPIPKIEGVEWDAAADMNLSFSGSLDNPKIVGELQIQDGFLALPGNKLTYETLEGKILLSGERIDIDHLRIEGDREGLLTATGAVMIRDGFDFDGDLTLRGSDFYLPFQKAISARISPDLHLTGGIDNPQLSGQVTITQSRIDLDRISRQRYSDIQVVETTSTDGDAQVLVASQSQDSELLSPLAADIRVHVPNNAWLKGQDVNAEISGDVVISKKPSGPFLLTGPLNTLRGNYYFMGKNFQLTKGNVDFLGLKEINPNLNIEARTRIKSKTIIVSLHGTAREMAIDLGSDPAMEESDIISYLVFGRSTDDLGGNQAFSVEKTALSYVGGLLATELRELLGNTAIIDSFSVESGSNENGIGAVTLGKYITPEIFISRHQGLSENEPSYQEVTYELTPDIKLETQIGRAYTNSIDITWEFDY